MCSDDGTIRPFSHQPSHSLRNVYLSTLVFAYQVLPPGEKKTQKVAIGDSSGVLQCFSIKKGEVNVSFKTLPSSLKISSISLGRSAKQRDKIFVAAGNTVGMLPQMGIG